MNQLLVGYARVSTEQQDLTAQRNSLAALGVGDDRIYVDHGLTGTNRDRHGLRLVLAACHSGDTLVVTKLDRLARSLPDARDILDELTQRHVRLSLGGSIHDPTDPVGRLLFNVLAMVAEFEADLISMRTKEGIKVAKAKGRLRGKQPKLSKIQSKHLVELYAGGDFTTLSWPNCSGSAGDVYRTIHRCPPPPRETTGPCVGNLACRRRTRHAASECVTDKGLGSSRLGGFADRPISLELDSGQVTSQSRR
ncbi:MAG: recombinase family protein [Microlunatus sp.]|nr:recombinase family protein [Microlunatus sp.]